MSTRKTTAFYGVLLVVASLFVGMVIASRFDLTPASSAQTVAVPPMNSAPINGPLDAQTFRNVAKMATPIVVNIRTEKAPKPPAFRRQSRPVHQDPPLGRAEPRSKPG